MKLILILSITLFCSISIFAQEAPLQFVAPQFLQSYYDHFSTNYLNAISAGRGHTGVGLMGNIENALQNPAAFSTDNSQMYIEISLKPPVKELNTLEKQNYMSVVPISMFAYGFKAGKHLCLGASYSVPQSIEYNTFAIGLESDVLRYPSYYLHQIALTGNYEWNNLHLGLNILNEFYSFKDQITLDTALFDRVDDVDYALRFQPGLFYRYKDVSAGISYLVSTKHTFEFRYQSFDTTLPSQLNAGLGLSHKKSRFAVDMNMVNCSEMSEEFKNRLDLKAGVETDYRKYTLRCGFMKIPSVWSGTYMLPHTTATPASDLLQPDSDTGTIGTTDQSMLTGGFTWHASYVDLTLSFIQDIQHNVNYTAVFGSMSINISKFNFKSMFPGDKKKEVPVVDDTEIEYLE